MIAFKSVDLNIKSDILALMNIFICHASEDKPSVEPIHLALAAAGYRVFYDESSLPAGGDFHGRILDAINESDLFLFMLSENSIRSGKYTLSELEFAKQKWTSPVNKVLTVDLYNIPTHQVPAYLTATTILTIKGNPAAEVRSAVTNIANENQDADRTDTDSIRQSDLNIKSDSKLEENNKTSSIDLKDKVWWLNNNWQWLIGIIIALGAILPPIWQSNSNPSNSSTINITGGTSGGTVIGTQVNNGFTLEDYNKELSNREKAIRVEYQALLALEKTSRKGELERRNRLKIELESTQWKLANLETSYAQTQLLLSEASKSLKDLKDKIPSELLEKAEIELAKGDTDIAYKAFAKIADDGSQPIAKAAYEAARLAEDEVRYADADRYYTKAILLDENNPTYLNAAGSMASTLRDFGRADDLLGQALTIRKKELGEEHLDTANSYNHVAGNILSQGRYQLEVHPDATSSDKNVIWSNTLAQERYEKAIALVHRSLEIRERELGEEHPDTAISYNNLGGILQMQGRFKEAEHFFRKGSAHSEGVSGEGDHDTAIYYSNIANNLSAQGRVKEAETVNRKAIAISERELGEEHPETAFMYNNLAFNLRNQEQFKEAELLHRKALAILERVFGEGHIMTKESYLNIALILDSLGKYKEAEPLYRKAVAISERVFGEEHLKTASSYNKFATSLYKQGRFKEAETLYRKGLNIHVRELSEEHSSTIESYNNVAVSVDQQGRYMEAEPLYHKAAAISERVFDEEDLKTASIYNNFAASLYKQRRYKEAETLYRKGLNIHERELSEEHNSTVESYSYVADSVNQQGRYKEAEPLYRKAVAISERVFGEEHLKTASSYNKFATSLYKQGRYKEAETLYRKGLNIYESKLSEKHNSTVESYSNVAVSVYQQGRYKEAETLYRKVLAISERVFGEENLNTALIYNNLARNFHAQERYEEAEPLLRKSVNILAKLLGSEHPSTEHVKKNLEMTLKKLSLNKSQSIR